MAEPDWSCCCLKHRNRLIFCLLDHSLLLRRFDLFMASSCGAGVVPLLFACADDAAMQEFDVDHNQLTGNISPAKMPLQACYHALPCLATCCQGQGHGPFVVTANACEQEMSTPTYI